MQSNKIRHWLPPLTALALAICALSAQAATGVRVIVQAWNPLDPDNERNETRLDHPTLVSDTLQNVWTQLRPKICEQLRLKMGLGGAAGGETLSNITCMLDEQVVLEVTSAGQDTLRATLAVSGYVEATTTTPDVAWGIGLDRGLDPRVSVAVTAKFDLILAVQPRRDQTLRVSQAQFTLNNATLDSQNFSGDMLVFVAGTLVPFFGGDDYKRLAEDAINAVSVDVAKDFNAGLAPVNAQLAGPAEYVRVGVSGSDHYISVALAPREIAPPSNGRMSGMLRWNPKEFMPQNGCQSFDIGATVQTGPVPMYTPNASAPTRKIGVFQASAVDASSCMFTMSGLAAGWPNVLNARVVGVNNAKSAGSSLYRVKIKLSGDGWNGRIVVPQPVADGRDYRVAVNLEATANEAQPFAVREKRTNPVINPADSITQQASVTGKGLPPLVVGTAVQQVDAVSLNPQPLPPQGEPVQAQMVRKAAVKQPLKSTTTSVEPQR